MNNLDAVIQDLVIANRILVKQEVVDAYGHVSVRHPNDPNRFLIVRPLAPELLRPEDIVELDLDGRRCGGRPQPLSRALRSCGDPGGAAVVHAHAEDTLPFGVVQGTKLRPVPISGSFIGAEVPVWDIAEKFGDTNLLVTNMVQARDLAECSAATVSR
jgi:ribulose-5-phosphate 4-epimerase/fuculose-1-phosphate aldolase